jgi:peptide methionine sulfoxide reductase msrA/msrB
MFALYKAYNMILQILKHTSIPLLLALLFSVSCAQNNDSKKKTMEYNELSPEEKRVIIHKGTEAPFSGKYEDHYQKGLYLCKRCDAPLYESSSKFDAQCGWPSFDDEIEGAVNRVPDADGRRTEILCNNCGAHLGHVFLGEGFTEKNTRHCVNSISLKFKPLEMNTEKTKQAKAYFAGGCFWGVEHFFENAPGVESAVSGFMGGHVKNPAYREVVTGRTGHAETVEVTYDPSVTDYETLAKLFFEIHDFTQVNRQGPDIGEQYRSVIFYSNEKEKETAEKLINLLQEKGYDVATNLTKAGDFYKAEEYYQDYYAEKGGMPYCHSYKKVFD